MHSFAAGALLTLALSIGIWHRGSDRVDGLAPIMLARAELEVAAWRLEWEIRGIVEEYRQQNETLGLPDVTGSYPSGG